MNNTSIQDILNVTQEAIEIYKVINLYKKKIDEQQGKVTSIEAKIKSMLPKGYFYTYDIDTSWNRPKKYSIKEVSVDSDGGVHLSVKEVFKKKPWPGFTGIRYYGLQEFYNLSIYKTEQEALEADANRKCPKCGGKMGHTTQTWCLACMGEREKRRREFNSNHTFYDPKKYGGHVVTVEYEDELTKERGYGGRHFIIHRLDTGEVIHTNNLWGHRIGPNTNNYPEIEFLDEELS